MPLSKVVRAGVAHPFGDERKVQQAFPSGVSAEEADPFLMCDYFRFKSDKEPSKDPDYFPVDWHPHRGMDILSYFRAGLGRHGDSLGNRETFETPGMQWMSVGSGVEHAEGGGTPKGMTTEGFQIWINVPGKHKMDAPIYGTEPPENIPQEEVAPGAKRRLLAGPMGDRNGAFRTKAAVQMVDFDLNRGAEIVHTIPKGLDCCLLYVYGGKVRVNGIKEAPSQSIVVFNANSDARGFKLKAIDESHALLFAGKRLREPIVWHGPIVMNTKEEIIQTFQELRSGQFPPVRVPWNYRKISEKPKDTSNTNTSNTNT